MNNNLVSISAKATISSSAIIGRFCIIEENVTLEENVIVQDFSMIMANSHIGKNTKIGTYTKVGRNVVIGENCSFTSYCEIRDNCKIGKNVLMGSRRRLLSGTIVEDGVIMKYSFVVTDTPKIGIEDVKKVGRLRENSKFGANVTIMPGINIGINAEIGACSQVRHDVPNNEVWYGNPARFFRKMIK